MHVFLIALSFCCSLGFAKPSNYELDSLLIKQQQIAEILDKVLKEGAEWYPPKYLNRNIGLIWLDRLETDNEVAEAECVQRLHIFFLTDGEHSGSCLTENICLFHFLTSSLFLFL